MPFITKIIGPDEELVGVARVHWIYGLRGLFWLVGLMLFGGIAKIKLSHILDGGLAPIGNGIFWIGLLFGVVMFIIYAIMMLYTELGLTTKRLIYKRGFIFTDVREVDLEEIKSASVDNGLLGRFLNYGYIKLDARFIEDVDLPAIKDPFRFTKAMNDIRSRIKDDSLRVVMNSGQGGSITPKADQPAGRQKHLNDKHYEAISDDAEKNIKEVVNEGRAKKPEIKVFKEPESMKPKSDEETMHDKILDDFDAAEAPPKPAKKKT